MSQYLVDRVTRLENVDVRTSSEIVGVESEGRLRAVVLSSGDAKELHSLPVQALFVCIGGAPRTTGADRVGLAADPSGYLRTGMDLSLAPNSLDAWPLTRQPLPLETNLPGVFAAGDVRSGSIKRCSAAIGEGSMAVALVHRRIAEVGGDGLE
jgi:thioredoxin reductase (NADPH)